MLILSQNPETFDEILDDFHKLSKEAFIKRLELYDRKIFASIDQQRFELIRLDERTILTTQGIITFKRRYYYDHENEQYVYLLDNQLGIPKNVRLSNELILKILDLASIMTYAEVGKHLSPEFNLSKSTIWRIINDTVIETYYDTEINRGDLKVHVQVDEKFINMHEPKKRDEKCQNKNKKRYYTVTIFAGKESYGKKGKNRLLNKTLISSANLKSLKEKVNYLLKHRYKVQDDEKIFISGDYASYIQTFADDLDVNATYVPDKYHTYKAIKDALPDFVLDDLTLNNPDFQAYLIKTTKHLDDVNIAKVRRALRINPHIFQAYLDPEYLGCSQEGQNSHVYAPRFGKYANRFHPLTIEKLALVREAHAMGATIKVCHSKRLIEEKIDLTKCPEISFSLNEPDRYVLDTRGMKPQTRKIFDEIKYGRI